MASWIPDSVYDPDELVIGSSGAAAFGGMTDMVLGLLVGTLSK